MVLEYFVGKELRQARKHVYEETVKSRGKGKQIPVFSGMQTSTMNAY